MRGDPVSVVASCRRWQDHGDGEGCHHLVDRSIAATGTVITGDPLHLEHCKWADSSVAELAVGFLASLGFGWSSWDGNMPDAGIVQLCTSLSHFRAGILYYDGARLGTHAERQDSHVTAGTQTQFRCCTK